MLVCPHDSATRHIFSRTLGRSIRIAVLGGAGHIWRCAVGLRQIRAELLAHLADLTLRQPQPLLKGLRP